MFPCKLIDSVSQNWCIVANLFSYVCIGDIEARIGPKRGRYAPVVLLHAVSFVIPWTWKWTSHHSRGERRYRASSFLVPFYLSCWIVDIQGSVPVLCSLKIKRVLKLIWKLNLPDSIILGFFRSMLGIHKFCTKVLTLHTSFIPNSIIACEANFRM